MNSLDYLNDERQQALKYADILDNCFEVGFGRLTEVEKSQFDYIVSAFSGTLIEKAVFEAVNGLKKGICSERNFIVLAAARTSILGAVYDSLLQDLDKHFSIKRTLLCEENFENEPLQLQYAIRHILTEIAVIGFSKITLEVLESFNQTLYKLSDEPALIRLSALMNGFINELKNANLFYKKEIPKRRWTDLWSRAMIMTKSISYEYLAEKRSGELFILGVDAPHHPRFITLNFYGIIEENACFTFTGFSISAHTVNSIAGQELWNLFDKFPILKKSLAQGISIKIKDIPSLKNNILLWDETCAKEGVRYNIFEKAKLLSKCLRTKVLASERHSVHISELIFLDECTYDDGKIKCGDFEVNVDLRRLLSFSPIDTNSLDGIYRTLGLLRYDNGWLFQPLAVEKEVKKEVVILHNGLNCLNKGKGIGDNVAILQERASRLLRK